MFNGLLITLQEFVTSKKFIAAVSGVFITLLAKLHFQVSDAVAAEIVSTVVAYILAQGWADKGKEAAKIQAITSQTGVNDPCIRKSEVPRGSRLAGS